MVSSNVIMRRAPESHAVSATSVGIASPAVNSRIRSSICPPVAAKVGLGSGRTYERAKSLLEEVEQAPDANEPDLGSHGEVEFDKGDAEDLVFETRSNA